MSTWVYVILAIVLTWLTVAGAGYLYYKDTQDTINDLDGQITQLRIDKVQLKTSLDSKEVELIGLKRDIKASEEAMRALDKKLLEANVKKGVLEKVLNEHNLTNLTAAKPGMIEKRINNATNETLEDLRSITSDN